MGKPRRRVLVWCIMCKHDVVVDSYRELSWKTCRKADVQANQWDVAWSDTPVALFKEISTATVRAHQRLNHFPLMQLLCRKDLLAITMRELMKALKASGIKGSFHFMPQTWVFPSDTQSFWAAVDHHFKAEEQALSPKEKKERNKRLKRKAKRASKDLSEESSEDEDELGPFTCIAKPQDGSQGKGIVIFQLLSEYKHAPSSDRSKKLMEEWRSRRIVVQRFVEEPLLVDGFKWDMRVYVLVTSLEPLTVYLYDDGLARFCTQEYNFPDRHNLEELEMHLTNFSINWESDAFIDTDSDDTGSKRSLAAVLNSCLGADSIKVWQSIATAVAQTLLVFAPKLRSAYRSHFRHLRLERGVESASVCFEVLGFDFLLDKEHKLYLLEVNSAPSLATETTLDERVKSEVLQESFELLGMDPGAKFKFKKNAAKEMKERRECYAQKRKEDISRCKSGTAAHVSFSSGLNRDGTTPFQQKASCSKAGADASVRASTAAAAQDVSGQLTQVLNESEVTASGSPLRAVRVQRAISDEVSIREIDESAVQNSSLTSDVHQHEFEDAGANHEENDNESVEDPGSDSDGEEADAQKAPLREMDGVGPYVTSHFVQVLPNPSVPYHDIILATAETLAERGAFGSK
eukprot:gnl/TRDRNA2_/TRDRNA2_134354_c0_seq1.p1 gnl/TRDRNA2_/TRDRNA2_134354_c0~~gnl/TRDRNA2_/TRDRNA2_134354_c0_seq1.p1  ORF type:complete len:632 (-),score=119.51 gnl/TRDRNA2_/TRDRNA2_134354_c0_seq1:28-1923(-)